MSISYRTHADHLDSIGLGKLTENQMRAVVEMVKARGMLREVPPERSGRGIVIAGGGKYLDWAWVNAKWLRTQGINDEIQVWHMGAKEMPKWAVPLFAKLGAETVDAEQVRLKHRFRGLGGWLLKAYAGAYCPFREVVSVDADCFLTQRPETVWDSEEFKEKPAVFFRDVAPCRKDHWHYIFAGVRIPDAEVESGLFFWDSVKNWEAIRFVNWFNEHIDVFGKHQHGDKESMYLGFGTTNTPFIFPERVEWAGWGIRHFWKDQPIAYHSMAYKRGEHNAPHPVIPSLFEEWRSFVP